MEDMLFTNSNLLITKDSEWSKNIKIPKIIYIYRSVDLSQGDVIALGIILSPRATKDDFRWMVHD